MKKVLFGLSMILALAFGFYACEKASDKGNSPAQDNEDLKAKVVCTTIQKGTLSYAAGHYLAGQPLATGYDIFGFNYQANMFNGSYANSYLGRDGFPPYLGDDAAYLLANPGVATHWAWPYRNDKLMMKWNDAWLSSKDCDGDGVLDRHYGFAGYKGSGAWLTNHQSGSYVNNDGNTCKWDYFVKIIAVPANAKLIGDKWFTANGVEIGPAIWGDFAITQEVSNDPCTGTHGLQYKSPNHPGLGNL